MSEFKFACPVCGQHMTADSNDTGSQVPCPTCFRKIVVPPAPASSDPKFVLSASEANKPKPPQASAPPQLDPIQKAPPPRTAIPIALIAGIVVVCAAGAAIFIFRDKIFHSKPAEETEETPGTNAEPEQAGTGTVAQAAAPGNTLWTLELTNVAFPGATVSGKIHNRDFYCERAVLQGGQLTLRVGSSGPVELGMNIFFFARQPEELSGKKIYVTTNDPVAPRVTLRWKDTDQPVTETFTGGYAMSLEFGTAYGNTIPGKIYVCLPDNAKSYVAGTFSGVIRRPAPPKKPKPKP